MPIRKKVRSGLAGFLRLPLFRKLSSLPVIDMNADDYLAAYFSTYSPQKEIIYPSGIQTELLPISKIESISWKFKSLQKRHKPEAFVIRLERGKVFGMKGGVLTKEGILLKDVSREFGNRKLHSVFSILKMPAVVHQKGNIAVLITDGGNTYYHWLFDILPRLHLLEMSGLTDKIDFFILPKIAHPFQRESLALFGIQASKILEAGSLDFYIEAENLFVPSLPSLLGTINDWASAYVSKTILAKELPQKLTGKRIYVSRKKATARKLLNENEIINFLAQYGFTIIVSEDYSLLEQAAIFNNAEIVVAAHGSGLSNIVFCKTQTTVIELFSSDFVVPCYWILANNSKLNYHFATSEGRDNLPFQPYWEGKNHDFYFPIERLESIFSSAQITR